MSKTIKAAAALVASVLALAPAARAHVAVAPTMAEPGATQVLTFIVGHGCDGQPTTALRVEAPKTVAKVEPQPKAGWTSSVESGPDGGQAVTWRGGEPLTKADSFAVRVRLPGQGERVAFVAVQTCGQTTVRWDEPTPPEGPKPKHPAPVVILARGAAGPTAALSPANEALPAGVQRLADGGLADDKQRPLYTFDFDTMAGMSHCEYDCARVWPPLAAPKGSRPFGAWSLVRRENATLQWALNDKPLYTYSEDRPGQPAAGAMVANWKRAK